MAVSRIALAIVLAAIPWLDLAGLGGLAGPVIRIVAILAALHGLGAIAARFRAAPTLAIHYGVAIVVAATGVLSLAHGATDLARTVLILAGLAGHAIAIGLYARTATVPVIRWWIAPVGLLAIAGAILAIGVHGDAGARVLDDDGNVLGQLRALADTGTFGTAIEYPRVASLGGFVALAAFARDQAATIEVALAVAVLALALARIRPSGPASMILATVAILAALAVPIAPLPIWIAAGLAIAAHIAVTEQAPAYLAGLVIAALVAVRLEFAPLAIAALIVDRRRITIAVALAALAPWVIGTLAATIPSAIAPLVVPPHDHLAGRITSAIGISLVALPIVWLAVRRAWFAIGLALSIGAIGSLGSLPLAYAAGIAGGVVALAAIGEDQIRIAIALLAASFVFHVRPAGDRVRDLFDGIELVRATGGLEPPRGYKTALAKVPAGATVALWVTHPELVDHARFQVIDLRATRIAATSRDAIMIAIKPAYLLVEDAGHLSITGPD